MGQATAPSRRITCRPSAVTLKRGRLIEARDRAGAPPVVVINESMARQYFTGLDPLGQRMQIGTEPDPGFPP